ncbi:TylF/MycF family methyltransferase [Agrobacterium tumefaciens]|nr:TylF/MycF family methyltransferase [Agrobacterium tumefaciens]
MPLVKMDRDKSIRYAAFLITYLPRLSAMSYAAAGAHPGWRYVPLIAAYQAVKDAPGACLEFGVFKGASINQTGKRYPNRRIYGFDSFEGFPDDGRPDWNQNFSVGGKLPEVPGNVTLIKGYFSETLPQFLKGRPEEICLINIDCDIYSSTQDVFEALQSARLLKAGVAISFDELINYDEYLFNEMLALFEMLEKTGLGIDWIAAHQNVRLIEDTVCLLKNGSHPSWKDDLAGGYLQQASLILTDDGLDFSILQHEHCRARVAAVADHIEAMASAVNFDLKSAS